MYINNKTLYVINHRLMPILTNLYDNQSSKLVSVIISSFISMQPSLPLHDIT